MKNVKDVLSRGHGTIGSVQRFVGSAILMVLLVNVVPMAHAAPWWWNALTGSPSITTATLPGAQVTKAYSFQLAATGGRTPYQWSVTAPLPAGLTLSAGGLLAGTPTAAGKPSLYLKVTDAKGKTASKTLTLTIAVAPTPPPVPLHITCAGPDQTLLPNGVCWIGHPVPVL